MRPKRTFRTLIITLILSLAVVILLYHFSQKNIGITQNFSRKFPPHPLLLTHSYDLQFNSYYISGITNNQVYLGNYTAPFLLTTLDHSFKNKRESKLQLSIKSPGFKALKLTVDSPFFHLADGSIPGLYRGKLNEGIAYPHLIDLPYFTDMLPLGPNSAAFKGISNDHENIVGKKQLNQPSAFFPKILTKQIDGLFCTDGILQSNKNGAIIHLYYYRNQFQYLDTNFNMIYQGKTIDTNAHAKISTAKMSSTNSITMNKPPLLINKRTTAFGNWLFVHSNLKSDNEDKTTFSKASVIDVYDLKNKGSYLFSFYLYDHEGLKLTDFFLHEDKLFAIFGRFIECHQLQPKFFSKQN